MEYTLILLGIFIVAISRAYYLDYKSDKAEFNFSLKNVGKKVLEYCFVLLIIFGIKSAYTYFIPLNKTHGVEYNSERLKLGIPQISENLKHAVGSAGSILARVPQFPSKVPLPNDEPSSEEILLPVL